MSIQLSGQAPAIVHSVGAEDSRVPSRGLRGRSEPQDHREAFVLACRDVDNEVRLRMARRGYQWE